MIKTIIDNADEEERKLNELRARISGKPVPDDTLQQDFTDSVSDAITDRVAEIQQRRFNKAMDAWLTKTKAECRGTIINYLLLLIFGMVMGFLIWYYFSRK